MKTLSNITILPKPELTLAVVLSIFLTLAFSTEANAEILCNQVFKQSVHGEDSAPLSNIFKTKVVSQTVISSKGQIRTLVERFFYYDYPSSNGYKITVAKLTGGVLAEPLPGVADESFQSIVTDSINFVLRSYAERRAWSLEFREHLYQQAIADSDRSTYLQFQVFDYQKYREDLKGTLKIIEAQKKNDEQLPVDTNLGIHIPFNDGVKFEVGNFAIDKDYNKQAFSNILVQLMLHAKEITLRPDHQNEQMIYFTYADSLSFRMYRSLGFNPIPGYEKPIEKDGTKWTPMGISAEDILRIPEVMKSTRIYWDDAELFGLRDTFFLLYDQLKEKLRIESWRVSSYYVGLHTPKKEESLINKFRTLRIVGDPETKLGLNFKPVIIPLPENLLTLQEGSFKTWADGKYSMSYASGVLHIQINDGSPNHHISLVVDRNFNTVKAVSIK